MADDTSRRIFSAGIQCPFCKGVFVVTEAMGVESHSDPPCEEFTLYHPKGTFLDRAGMKAGWTKRKA
jgi:hypothetical protein